MIKYNKVLYTIDKRKKIKFWVVIDFRDWKYIIYKSDNPEWYKVYEQDFNDMVRRLENWVIFY